MSGERRKKQDRREEDESYIADAEGELAESLELLEGNGEIGFEGVEMAAVGYLEGEEEERKRRGREQEEEMKRRKQDKGEEEEGTSSRNLGRGFHNPPPALWRTSSFLRLPVGRERK